LPIKIKQGSPLSVMNCRLGSNKCEKKKKEKNVRKTRKSE